MNRTTIKKLIAVGLIVSGLILLILKIYNLPSAYKSWETFAEPHAAFPYFAAAVALEILFLAARFTLGYMVYIGKNITGWLFYPLSVFTAFGGLTGVLLVVALLVERYWPLQEHANKRTLNSE